MKKMKMRLSALGLAFCLTLGLGTTAVALDVTTLRAESEKAGFTYKDFGAGSAVSVSAAVLGGKASTSISAVPEKAGYDVYAAVDIESGVRFVRTTPDGGSYMVDFAKFGKKDFDIMLVQPAIDGGTIDLQTSYTRSGSSYTLTYATTLKMSEELAQIAAVNKDDSKMANMVFTIYVDDPYINSLSSIDESRVQLVSAVYDSDSLVLQKVDGVWTATYKLKAGWNSGTSAGVCAKLQEQMSLTITSDPIPYNTLKNYLVRDTVVDKLYSHGWLTITYNAGTGEFPGLVGLKQITLPSNLAELTVGEPINGGSVKPPAAFNSADHIKYIVGFTDGLVHPEKNITRGQFASVLYRLLNADRRDEIFTSYNDFSDVSRDLWCNKAVSSMANGGYIYGYNDGTFRSEQSITRAEFVAMLVRFIGIDEAATANFSDVSRNYWAYKYIATATEAGWIKGYNNGTYQPDRYISRAEAMVIMNRVLNRGVDKDSKLVDFHKWPDNKPDAWYYWDVIEATNDHEYTGKRPSEDWSSLEIDYYYDIVKYENP